jgi:aminoglycoside phosphotransferase
MIRDDQIQIACPFDDQLQGHLDNLKQAVATTNQVYRAQLQATDDEKRSHEELLQKLRF